MRTAEIDEQQLARIRALVGEHLEVDPATLTMTTDVVRVCGEDRLAMMDLRVALEAEFKVSISSNDWDRLLTLEHVYRVLAGLAAW
jgi:acyl carrier protein